MPEQPINQQLILIAKLLVPIAYICLGLYIRLHNNITDLGTLGGIKIIDLFGYLLIIYGAFRAWRIYASMKSNEN